MFRQVQILLLCWSMVGLLAGCYRETSRRGDLLSLDETPEATSQPAEETTPVASAPAEPATPVTTAPTGEAPATTQEARNVIQATIETNFGHMVAELWPDEAPETVANFVKLAKSGFYENLPCHRKIEGYMVQLGKPTDPAKARQLTPIKGEFSTTLKHDYGILSMARRPSDPDSATSQFFICFKPKNEIQQRALSLLDGEFAIFGKVVRGLNVLDQIEAVRTTTQPMGPGRVEPSKPSQTILLKAIRIAE